MSSTSVEELKASPEYQALGIIGRERMLFENFPELEEAYKDASASHLESVAYPPELVESDTP